MNIERIQMMVKTRILLLKKTKLTQSYTIQLFFCLAFPLFVSCFEARAQYESGYGFNASDPIDTSFDKDHRLYFNLDAGDVIVTPNSYTGYYYDNSGVATYFSSSDAGYGSSGRYLIYIYQAKPGVVMDAYPPNDLAGLNGGGSRLPVYPAVTTTSGATGASAVNIVGVSDVQAVIDGWDARITANNASAPSNQDRYSTEHKISLSCQNIVNVCLDNVWSTYQTKGQSRNDGGLAFYPQFYSSDEQATITHHARVNVYLRGDNRLGNVFYTNTLTRKISDDPATYEYIHYKDTHLRFRSAEGDGSVSGTLTLANLPSKPGYNYENSVIGGSDGYSVEQGPGYPLAVEDAIGIEFRSGTVFAGATYQDDCTAIGAGSNGSGEIKIFGGQVTAVSASNGPAIGGGAAMSGAGGPGEVTISGGTVYAFNNGIYRSNTSTIAEVVAIGGGSSIYHNGSLGKVTITGGTVYAQSMGGPAIGGGSTCATDSKRGGTAIISISGTADVTAISKSGTLYGTSSSTEVSATRAIGGGMSSPSGTPGYLKFTMSGGTLKTGSISSGGNKDGDYNLDTISITGGDIYGQFLLESASSGISRFSMTGGTIHGKYNNTFTYMQPDGYALWMNDADGVASINGASATISGCTGAVNGGAVCVESGAFIFTNGTIENCSATNGGAIYANGGTVEVAGGTIRNNSATGNTAGQGGGGVFISSTGSVTLSGTAAITGNSVPTANGQGGGVYQGGTLTANSASLTVSGNTKGTAKATTANNVYLPDGKKITAGSSLSAAATIGIYTQKTYVENGNSHIPVLYSSNSTQLSTIYKAMIDGESNIGDDRGIHRPEYTSSDVNNIYFTKVFFDYGPYSKPFVGPISSADSLYKFMCWVNGLNGYSATHPGAAGNVTADIDMSGISHWIPIGEPNAVGPTTPYTGTFNGNGHTISNLTFSDDLVQDWGLFGTIDGATVSDVFVKGFSMTAKPNKGSLGTLVGKMLDGTVERCGGTGTLSTTEEECVTGGLVGKQEDGTIHSSFATAMLTGYQMGGLVGETASGSDLKNSFANASFTLQLGSSRYLGGLVGVNKGTVENCYARIRNGSNPSSDYFGWIAGQNDGGAITYCYHPTTAYGASYVKSGSVANTCTTFGATATPYGYMHNDNQMTDNDDNDHIVNGNLDRFGLKGLLATLNDWVESSSTYSKWMRTCASPINGDYPIHNYTDYVCVGSPDNVVLEYHTNFNTKFSEYITANSGTIYLYQSPSAAVTSTLSNSSGVPALYIHEDVVMMHTSAIKAHVGITLDNSAGTIGAHPSFSNNQDAIDWHFFSSALTNSPIGLHYGAVGSPTEDNNTYNAYEYPDWHATFTNINGYFPLNLNDYYTDWDLYAYYEPDYHWVNYKRNSASHWHEDWPDIPIPYTNHTNFQPGYGYMVALKEEGYLQAYGTLNTHPDSEHPLEVDIDYTPGISWTTRKGQNLLGNPYQSYLDFNAFVGANRDLWGSDTTPFYIVMDEDQADYVIYAYTASYNAEAQASRYIHPHQGFMIKAETSGRKAKFHDEMRTTMMESGWSSDFRDGGSQPNYALVNLFVKDKSGNRDIVTVELGRPEKGGVPKSKVPATSTGRVSCHYEGESYALVFTEPGLDAANIRFVADEDGEYTMTWSTHNGEFSYLHLIDNMTGADIDCLSTSEYKFSARESDYNSRFRLVFDYTGIDDHEVPEPVEGPATFAYYANGEIHLTGTPDARARLQIIDMTGRVIVSRDGVHTVSTTGLAAGVYVLRLTTANGTRIQKIVLN